MADSSDVVADSIESLADYPVFVAVFMTVGLLAVPDALLTAMFLLLTTSDMCLTLPRTTLKLILYAF